MKKAHFLFKIAMALLAFVLLLSCDTGGGGGGVVTPLKLQKRT